MTSENSSTIRILLADDHPFIKESLSLWLSDQDDISIVKEASSGKEVITYLEEYADQVDIVLMDLFMEEPERAEPAGLRAAREILEHINYREIRTLKIILFSAKDRALYIAKAYHMGVDGFLLKKHDTKELLQAIQAVTRDELYYNNEVRQMIDQFLVKKKLQLEPLTLTSMEQKVLELTAEGYSAKLLADKLGSAQGTVETHKRNIIKKLKAFNTAHMVSIGYQQGLLKVE